MVKNPISIEIIERSKESILNIINPYITLKRRGNSYMGLCPFHDEKTPSFVVYPKTETFKCFGCGVQGDSIKF